jgi:hypothetical protein
MDIPQIPFSKFEDTSEMKVDDEYSNEKVKELEKEIELTNQKYMQDFQEQMKNHQMVIEKMNTATTQFIEIAMNALGDSKDK